MNGWSCEEITEHEARAWLLFFVGLHDLGKATPPFQGQVQERAEVLRARFRLSGPSQVGSRRAVVFARQEGPRLPRRGRTLCWSDRAGRRRAPRDRPLERTHPIADATERLVGHARGRSIRDVGPRASCPRPAPRKRARGQDARAPSGVPAPAPSLDSKLQTLGPRASCPRPSRLRAARARYPRSQ
ncbi:MAG: hypothetical protein HYV07_02235 [Deltaproteobacteria bacterium]|nr:hypothetical protein [Deltaproteobacteria bacterium]